MNPATTSANVSASFIRALGTSTYEFSTWVPVASVLEARGDGGRIVQTKSRQVFGLDNATRMWPQKKDAERVVEVTRAALEQPEIAAMHGFPAEDILFSVAEVKHRTVIGGVIRAERFSLGAVAEAMNDPEIAHIVVLGAIVAVTVDAYVESGHSALSPVVHDVFVPCADPSLPRDLAESLSVWETMADGVFRPLPEWAISAVDEAVYAERERLWAEASSFFRDKN